MAVYHMLDTRTGDVLIPIATNAGAPTNGTSGTLANIAQPGWLLIDTTSKVLYLNTNTSASPTWAAQNAAAGSGAYTGTFDGVVGGVTPAAVSVTTATATGLVTAASVKVDTGTKTATASAGAATLNKSSGIVTSEALTTAAGSTYTLAITNSTVAAGDAVVVSVDSNGSTGLPLLTSVKSTSNTITIIVTNAHASVAFNAALKFAFVVFKA